MQEKKSLENLRVIFYVVIFKFYRDFNIRLVDNICSLQNAKLNYFCISKFQPILLLERCHLIEVMYSRTTTTTTTHFCFSSFEFRKKII